MTAARPEAAGRQRRYRQAAIGYLGLGVLVILLHLFSPDLVAERRWRDAVYLLAAVPFLVLFAMLLDRGDRMIAAPLRGLGASSDRAMSWGRLLQDALAILLTFPAIGRTVVFGANGLGWSPRIRGNPLRLEVDSSPPEPLLLISALLTAGIVVLLLRAAWVPLLRRRH